VLSYQRSDLGGVPDGMYLDPTGMPERMRAELAFPLKPNGAIHDRRLITPKGLGWLAEYKEAK
jgi:hypothetical protein